MPEPLTLSAGESVATIDEEQRACLSWRVNGRDVLGDGGMHVLALIAGSSARLEAKWRLDEEGLRVTLQVDNASRAHAPFGIGVRVALAPLADQVQLLVPAEEVWADGVAVSATGDLDFRRPKVLTEAIQARFTRRHFAYLQGQLAVLAREREVWLTTSADFREVAVDIQANGAGVIESATCVADAVASQADRMQTGLRVLAPGETWRGHALLVVR